MSAAQGKLPRIETGATAQIADILTFETEFEVDPVDYVIDGRFPARSKIGFLIEVIFKHLFGQMRLGPKRICCVNRKGFGTFMNFRQVSVHIHSLPGADKEPQQLGN